MKSEVIIAYLESEVIRTGSHKQNYHALTTLTTNKVITPLTTINQNYHALTTLTPNEVITPLTPINQNYHALTTLTPNAVITTLTTKN